MKIRFVATPAENELAPEIVAACHELQAAGFSGFQAGGGERRIDVDLAAGAGADDASRAAAAVTALSRRFAGWPRRSTHVRVETDAGVAGGATENTRSAAAGWTPESANLRDLNGSGVNAALPKVLAASRSLFSAGENSTTAPHVTTGTLPLSGGRAAVVRETANRFLALDAYHGAMITVAELVREQACAGARPLAIAERFEIGQSSTTVDIERFDQSVRGLAEACGFFGLPVVATTLTPAPVFSMAVVGAGLVAGEDRVMPRIACASGQQLVLLGEAPNEIGGSRYLAVVHGIDAGPVPILDFAAEKKLEEVLLALGEGRAIQAARSVAAGGLLAAAAEMLLAGGQSFGARIDLTSLGGHRADALLFGESQARAIVALAPERVGTVLAEAHMRGVPAALIGEVVSDPVLELKTRSLATDWKIADLRRGWDATVRG